MAIYELNIGVEDIKGDMAYTGAQFVAASEPTTEIAAYIAVIEANIDGDVAQYKFAEVTNQATTPGSMGPNLGEYTGTVIVKDLATLKEYPLQLNSIKAASVDKTGGSSGGNGVPFVAASVVASLVSAFAAMLGKTSADFRVTGNFVSERRR